MDTIGDRGASDGVGVAYGDSVDIERVVETGKLVEHVHPTGNVRVDRSGRRSTHPGERLAYGHPVPFTAEDH